MLPLPQRPSLISEVARVIREGIENGQWQGSLPGERRLSEELQVSRPTIQHAVEILAKEGWIRNKGRYRRTILAKPARISKTLGIVVMLTPVPMENLEPHLIIRTDFLRRIIASEGMELVMVHGPRYFSKRPALALDGLLRETPAACWLLVRSTREVQTWFDRKKLPAIIMGSAFDGIDICSMDYDYVPLCNHAIGAFVSRGHKKIGFLIDEPRTAGDIYSESAFREACEKSAGKCIVPLMMKHNGTTEGICETLDRAFRLPDPPTALLVSHAGTAITMVTHLAKRRKLAGRDYAYICRENDPVLRYLIPGAARYGDDPTRYSRRFLSLIKSVISRLPVTNRHVRLMAEFIPAESTECKGFGRPDV